MKPHKPILARDSQETRSHLGWFFFNLEVYVWIYVWYHVSLINNEIQASYWHYSSLLLCLSVYLSPLHHNPQTKYRFFGEWSKECKGWILILLEGFLFIWCRPPREMSWIKLFAIAPNWFQSLTVGDHSPPPPACEVFMAIYLTHQVCVSIGCKMIIWRVQKLTSGKIKYSLDLELVISQQLS